MSDTDVPLPGEVQLKKAEEADYGITVPAEAAKLSIRVFSDDPSQQQQTTPISEAHYTPSAACAETSISEDYTAPAEGIIDPVPYDATATSTPIPVVDSPWLLPPFGSHLGLPQSKVLAPTPRKSASQPGTPVSFAHAQQRWAQRDKDLIRAAADIGMPRYKGFGYQGRHDIELPMDALRRTAPTPPPGARPPTHMWSPGAMPPAHATSNSSSTEHAWLVGPAPTPAVTPAPVSVPTVVPSPRPTQPQPQNQVQFQARRQHRHRRRRWCRSKSVRMDVYICVSACLLFIAAIICFSIYFARV